MHASASPPGSCALRDVTLVIPNLNGAAVLPATLSALPEAVGSLSTVTVLVDNASSDDSVALVRDGFPEVSVLQNPENLGFAAACNRGGRHATSRYVLLLNSDVTMLPASLERLVAVMDGDPTLGALSPLMHWPNGRVQGPPMPPWRRRGPGLVRMNWLPGTCLLLRREALDAIGWLDEGFFFYNEDIDLSWRLRKAGWTIACAPMIHVRHYEGAATRSDPAVLARAIREGYAGSVLLARKHHPWAVPLVRFGISLEVRGRAWWVQMRTRRGFRPTLREQAIVDLLPSLDTALL
ncbi:MAG: glycosyltransferase family 2 protein [Candidatus Sericytochromatia bacterium]|nr:glycosyltransferase family 2 protein [Candidatus Sericytochromatia bacterium]